jgi:Holliday junction resolvasome RuvABC endonuclease subunit
VNGVNEVHMEGYAYGSVAGLVFQIAEHAGLLKHYMWRNGIKFNIHAPTSIKKVYTGKGNANKDAMGAKLFESEAVDVSKEFNLKDFGNPASDVVDAYAIALMSKVQN